MKRILYVLGGHLLLLFVLCYRHQTHHQLKVVHHLVDTYHIVCDSPALSTSTVITAEVIAAHEDPIQTKLQPEEPPTPILTPSPVQPQAAPAPKPITKPQPSNKPTATVKPKPQTTAQPQPKKKLVSAPPSQHQALAALMEKSLKTLDSPKTSPKGSSTQKISLGSLHSDHIACSYQDQLVALLEDLLVFPEVGDVSVEIKILSSGKITACTVLKSLSAENQAYVLKVLPTLTLPPCTDLKKEENKTLRLTLVGRSDRKSLMK